MARAQKAEASILEEVPARVNESEILYLLNHKEIDWHYVNAVKKLTAVNDDVLADWLNLSVKTFREYRKPHSVFKENFKEQVLVLLALFKHGTSVFGTAKEFENWLNTANFHFDGQKPASFLSKITGVRFVDERLTAMEHGDNV
jgi:uncharacterized protein (DUF2384 family)